SRASKHIVNTIVLWLRFTLVSFVWLGLLPWSVRWMWRFWFWVGGGSWAWWKRKACIINTNVSSNNSTSSGLTEAIEIVNSSGIGNLTSEHVQNNQGYLLGLTSNMAVKFVPPLLYFHQASY